MVLKLCGCCSYVAINSKCCCSTKILTCFDIKMWKSRTHKFLPLSCFFLRSLPQIYLVHLNLRTQDKCHFQTDLNFHKSIHICLQSSLRKHPFLLTLRCWGRFARRKTFLRAKRPQRRRARRNGCFRRLLTIKTSESRENQKLKFNEYVLSAFVILCWQFCL